MSEPHTGPRFPGESEQYRQAREELLGAEMQLREHEEAVAAQRRALPLGGEVREDYVFHEWDAAAGAPCYSRDYLAEDDDGGQWPLATVFARRDGKIHHFWSSELFWAPRAEGQNSRHVDYMWPLWAVLDRTPAGRDPVWGPKLDYR